MDLNDYINMDAFDDFKDELPNALKPLVKQYKSSIVRMAKEDFWAFIRSLLDEDTPKAASIVRKNMTMEEVGEETKELTYITRQMALNEAKAKEFIEALLQTVLRTTVKILIGI